jgi:hypothetical protein
MPINDDIYSRISLGEARKIALRILEETERRLQAEREREWQLMMTSIPESS